MIGSGSSRALQLGLEPIEGVQLLVTRSVTSQKITDRLVQSGDQSGFWGQVVDDELAFVLGLEQRFQQDLEKLGGFRVPVDL